MTEHDSLGAVSAEAGPEVVIRRASHEDVEQLLDLLEAVAGEGRWIGTELPIDRAARRRQLDETIEGDDRSVRYVAVASGAVVGNLGMELRPYKVADLGMFVRSEWRGGGVGSALLDAGIAWARSVGAHKVALQLWPHNRAALALYRKFGFEQEGLLRRHYPRRNGELWDAMVMGLVLDEDTPGSSLH